MTSQAYTHEPDPVHKDTQPVWELVVRDMIARDHEGRLRYGTPLQHFNGRNPAVDAYQESLDQTVYLRQVMDEFNILLQFVDATVIFMNDCPECDKSVSYQTMMRLLREMGK